MRYILFAAAMLLGSSSPGFPQAGGQSHFFNVRNFGATGNGTTDDSAAIGAAASAAAAGAADGQATILYFPSGAYRMRVPLPTWNTPVSVLGDGHAQSIILVDTALSGDLFSWSEVWAASNYGVNTISALAKHKAGVEIKGIRIVGNRATPNPQNAFVFYDRADQVFMQDVGVFYIKGRALYSGVLKMAPQSYMRESHFNSLRFFNCGDVGTPVVEFNSQGTGDATNEVDIDALDIYAPYGPGVTIHSNGTPVREIKFSKLRIEGLEKGAVAADLLQVGKASSSGNVNNIDFEQAELIDPYAGFSALHFDAPNLSVAPYQIRFQGVIGGGVPRGGGIKIDAGRSLFFDLRGIHTSGVNVSVASSKTVGEPIVLNGYGQEKGWTRSIDPSSSMKVKRPAIQDF